MTNPTPNTEMLQHALQARPLDHFFSPRNVAVIGANDDGTSIGGTVMLNLINGQFDGRVYPVNPRHPTTLGLMNYAKIGDVPTQVDLAIIATPSSAVRDVVLECIDAKVSAAVILSAGFKEAGESGKALERQILAEARCGHLRIIGPNCMGLINPSRRLNASFGPGMPRLGNLAFISQSGALCSAILDWSQRNAVGFSAFVSVGSMLDVGWGDLLDHFGSDTATQAILLYMESIGDARSFLSAAREVALTKPIIVMKSGRTQAAAKAAQTHTGALVGRDDIADAAFDRAGILRVNSIHELFAMAEVVAKQPRPKGRRLAIVTNAGGPGVLAADAVVNNGGEVAELAGTTIAKLGDMLPETWSNANPVDLLGDADPIRFSNAMELVLNDPSVDGVLAILTPQEMTDPLRCAEAIRGAAANCGKPVLASWMGGPRVLGGQDLLRQAGIPTFDYPDEAARAFALLCRHAASLRRLYETPRLSSPNDSDAPDLNAAEEVIRGARRQGFDAMNALETMRVLQAYQIPILETRAANTVAEAVAHADAIGYPVVLKAHSRRISHKSAIGGVILHLGDAAAVAAAFDRLHATVENACGAGGFDGVIVQPMANGRTVEAIIGCVRDEQFGPVLMFGSGGTWTEINADRALALPPLTTSLARHLVDRTRVGRALRDRIGLSQGDIDELDRILVRFSRLAAQQPGIREIEINPLLLGHGRIAVADARAILHSADVASEQLSRPAIRPYPQHYVSDWTTTDGTHTTIRPIRPEDEPLIRSFHEGLSDQSVLLRYFRPMQLSERVAHERLVRVCFGDYERELALVVDHRDPMSGKHEILAVGRLSRSRWCNEAEFAVVVADAWQGKGIGYKLVGALIAVARREGIGRLSAYIMPFNRKMHQICTQYGFTLDTDASKPLAFATMALDETNNAREPEPTHA